MAWRPDVECQAEFSETNPCHHFTTCVSPVVNSGGWQQLDMHSAASRFVYAQ